MSTKKFKWLQPEEVPKLASRRRTEYDECIEEFLQSGLESARVNIPNTHHKTLVSQLLTRIKEKGLKDEVAVRQRKGAVFLTREAGEPDSTG